MDKFTDSPRISRRDRLSTNTFLSLGAQKSLKYWGFRHREQIVLIVMGTLFLCSRELVQRQGRGYKFTISENESTILLFGVGRDYEFIDKFCQTLPMISFVKTIVESNSRKMG